VIWTPLFATGASRFAFATLSWEKAIHKAIGGPRELVEIVFVNGNWAVAQDVIPNIRGGSPLFDIPLLVDQNLESTNGGPEIEHH
jgi:hypothetical protein